MESCVKKEEKACLCADCMGDYFYFLDLVRATGRINMFGAGEVLRENFTNLTKEESWTILEAWMNNFKEKGQE